MTSRTSSAARPICPPPTSTAGAPTRREGIGLGRRRGSRSYQYTMIGNTAWCAMRVGEWDWALTILDEWLEIDMEELYRFEFLIDRAFIRALRGIDVTAEIGAANRLIGTVTDPQYGSYVSHALALASLASGDYRAAVEHAELAADVTRYFTSLSLPVGARAALWAGDAAPARRAARAGRAAGGSGEGGGGVGPAGARHGRRIGRESPPASRRSRAGERR